MRALVFVLLLVSVLALLERFFAPRDSNGARIRVKKFSRERLTDLAHILFNQLITKRIVQGVALVVIIGFVFAFRLPRDASHLTDVWHRDARITRLPILVQVPLALVFADFAGYWAHRALHVGALWNFHAVHHSSRALDWLAGARNHPVGEAFTTVIVLASLLVAGFDPRVLALIGPLGLYAILLHANVRFGTSRIRYVFVTPHLHRWHHAHPDAFPEDVRNRMKHGVNFAGLLSVWDLLFGTFYAPAITTSTITRSDPEKFGADAPVPQKFFAQLAFPFRRRRVSSD